MALPPVRPQVWPPAQTDIRPGRNDTRAAAQKAFFEAAMGRAAGAATQTTAQAAAAADPQPQRPTASPAQAVRSVAAAEARATDRLPPPGSIINILV
jgi:hypothetical protein